MNVDLIIFLIGAIITTSIAFWRRNTIRNFKKLGYDEKVVIVKLMIGCVFCFFGFVVCLLVKIFK
jgi:uncharacterized membrane protein YidH (DUF202 family)